MISVDDYIDQMLTKSLAEIVAITKDQKNSCDDIAPSNESMHSSHSNITESVIIEAREAAIDKASREALQTTNDAALSCSRYDIHFMDPYTYSLMKIICQNIQYTIWSISW